MAVLSGFPVLLTPDLARAVSFYRAAFGAEQTYAYADERGETTYVALVVGGAVLGVGQADVGAVPAERVSLWFYVDDVDSAFRDAVAAGARPVSGPSLMPWGERVARVRDPDGTAIDLGSAAVDPEVTP